MSAVLTSAAKSTTPANVPDNTVVPEPSSVPGAGDGVVARLLDGLAQVLTRYSITALRISLGLVFLGIKVYEYADKFEHHHVPGANFISESPWAAQEQIFFSLYFTMTGLHALHMIIGLGIMTVISIMAWKRQFDSSYFTPVEVSGLYWHFVDIVWIFLFPLLYLIGYHVAG